MTYSKIPGCDAKDQNSVNVFVDLGRIRWICWCFIATSRLSYININQRTIALSHANGVEQTGLSLICSHISESKFIRRIFQYCVLCVYYYISNEHYQKLWRGLPHPKVIYY